MAAGKSSPAFPIGHMRLSHLASCGWKEDSPANNRSFLSPLFGSRSPSSRPIEASVHPGPRAHPGAVHSLGWPSVLVQTRRLSQPWVSGGRHSFRLAMLAATGRQPRRPGWGFSVGRPWRVGGQWSRGGLAQSPPPSRRIVGRKSRCRIAAWQGHWLPRGLRLLASVLWTGAKAAPGPPWAHPAQDKAIVGTLWKEAALPSSDALTARTDLAVLVLQEQPIDIS